MEKISFYAKILGLFALKTLATLMLVTMAVIAFLMYPVLRWCKADEIKYFGEFSNDTIEEMLEGIRNIWRNW